MIRFLSSRLRNIRASGFCSRRTFSSTGDFLQASVRESPFEIICDNEQKVLDVLNGPLDRIRNFSIIAHIDHGKSTLADRMLELAGNVRFSENNKQLLDMLEVERERGITIKAQTASMFYQHNGSQNPGPFLLNLIDTPGHVDFSYEVSRSLAACQGVLLLVDATQGIQAQTMANFYLALEAELDVIPVLTKMDLFSADPAGVSQQMVTAFGVNSEDILQVSAKTGVGVPELFPEIVKRIRAPTEEKTTPGRMRALLFDSWFDSHRGVIALFKIVEGELKKGDYIASYHTGQKYEIMEVGLLMPYKRIVNSLKCGQVGYVVANIKNSREVRLGDTFYNVEEKSKPFAQPTDVIALPGFKPAKSMVYAGLYPVSSDDFEMLKDAVEKLTLNDASVSVQRETSNALGMGFRCGFLGVLHMEVFHQRLEKEFGAQVIATSPTVPYRAKLGSGEEQLIDNPAVFPEGVAASQLVLYEPMVKASIVAPAEYLGVLLDVCQDARGEQTELTYLTPTTLLLRYEFPMNEIVADFYSKLKSITAGYASFDYEECGYKESDVVKLDILINGKVVDALALICHRSKAETIARKICSNLKETIERQNFEIIIQAKHGKTFIARERIAPFRKDVLIKSGKTVGGGDITRKKKLLEKQKEGKRRMKMVGEVELSQEAFFAALKTTSN